MSKSPTVVVGMSGGVDSSVSALLLKEAGYNVIGLFMKNWEEVDENGVCKSTLDYEDVVRVCDQLDIPHYSVNFVKEYWDQVFSESLKEYEMGYTPNPDILCNREIKFKVFFQKAKEYGADFLATGHYCQRDSEGNLLKGLDSGKDQSYFLYTVKSSVLKEVLFPVGHLLKKDLRQLAKKHHLATAEKKDSTGICFIGKRNFKTFLNKFLPTTPGDFIDPTGKVVGQHDGIAYYTIGQRKGLKIGGEGEAWFVAKKDPIANTITLVQGEDHPLLYTSKLIATDLSWVNEAPNLPFNCKAKIRYRQEDQECVITKIDANQAFVEFKKPQRAVTPRQSIVFYQDNTCLGGGMITNFVV